MPILMVYLKANKENYLFYFVGVVLILKYHNLFWKVYIIFVFLYFHIKCSAFVFQSDLTNSCKCFSILMWFCFHLRRKSLWMRYRHCFSSYSNSDEGVNNDKFLWFCQFLCYHTTHICSAQWSWRVLWYRSTRYVDVFDIWSWPHFHGLLTLLDLGQFCVLGQGSVYGLL